MKIKLQNTREEKGGLNLSGSRNERERESAREREQAYLQKNDIARLTTASSVSTREVRRQGTS